MFSMGENHKPADIAKAAVEHASKNDQNVVILDTAGRLHIDEDMMNELVEIKEAVEVHQTILVVDAMTGQDAVNVAGMFNDKIGIDGVILTKLDGDTRGGAALSIRSVTGKPILYIGMGEKLSDLEQFYPDRMASRILGMGDILSLIEKAESQVDEEKAKELGVKPMAAWVAGALAGVAPEIMGVGPVAATKKVMEKTGLSVDAFDLIEANEAFAAQSLAVARDLSFDMTKVNVNGGAIALGHPVGASGCRILVTLLHEMEKRGAKRGMATLCIGGGMGCATVVERE